MPTNLTKKEEAPKELLGDDHPEWDKSKEREFFPNGGGPIVWILIAFVATLIGGLFFFVVFH